MPIILSTPTRMSLMTSGGMRRERISDRASGLMFPTARFASSTKGCRGSDEDTKVSKTEQLVEHACGVTLPEILQCL